MEKGIVNCKGVTTKRFMQNQYMCVKITLPERAAARAV
jgi:hypothetical protein